MMLTDVGFDRETFPIFICSLLQEPRILASALPTPMAPLREGEGHLSC